MNFIDTLDSIPVGIFYVDTKGNYQYVNHKFCQMTGLSSEKAIGLAWLDNIHPDDQELAYSHWGQLLKSETPFNLEFRMNTPEGESIWLDGSFKPVKDADKNITHFVGTTHDITKQKLSLSEAQSSEAKTHTQLEELESIYKSAPIGLSHMDTNFVVKRINSILAEINGASIEDHIGRCILDVIPDVAPHISPILNKVVAEKTPITIEMAAPAPGEPNKMRDWLLTNSPLLNNENQVTGVTATLLDITDQKRAVIEQKEKENAIKENRAKTEFLANMSHEIRTPLTSILGWAELMAKPTSTKESRKNAAERIRHQAHHLQALLDDILDLNKVASGVLSVNKLRFDLKQELVEIINLAEVETKRKNLSFDFVCHNDIPAFIETDPLRFRQVILNLINNAVKFTESGIIQFHISLTQPDENKSYKQLLINIIDSGIGLDAKDQEIIFDSFKQVDSSITRKFQGSGLGLNLSKDLANALGGEVWLDSSSPGKGSVFSFALDIGELTETSFINESDFARKKETTATAPLEEGKLSNAKILVVEDNPDIKELVEEILMAEGASIETAENGEEGYKKALAQDYNLVLMDLHMPVFDGYQAIKKLRQLDYKGVVIALTGRAMSEDVDKCLAMGFTDMLKKPFLNDDLVEVVLNNLNTEQ